MGKKNWCDTHYSPICASLGVRPTLKVSHYSDDFDPNDSFAAIIMYHWRGRAKWRNEHKGQNGRAFYVVFANTKHWPAERFRRAGKGMVHDYIFQTTFGEAFDENNASVGGFAIHEGRIKYSSIWLNMKSSDAYELSWESDGSKYLSVPEQSLAEWATSVWINHGKGNIHRIPDALHNILAGMCTLPPRDVTCGTPLCLLGGLPGGWRAGEYVESCIQCELGSGTSKTTLKKGAIGKIEGPCDNKTVKDSAHRVLVDFGDKGGRVYMHASRGEIKAAAAAAAAC